MILPCVQDVKTTSPDYVGVPADKVVTDFLQRIDHYKDIYEPLDETKEGHLSFMKTYNTGQAVKNAVFSGQENLLPLFVGSIINSFSNFADEAK